MDYTAVGDATNVAARMQQAGEPGRVTISDATHRLVRGFFETRPLGELAVKGKAEAVAAWEVVAARETRTRLEVGRRGRAHPLRGTGAGAGPPARGLRARARRAGAGGVLGGRGRHGQVAPARRAAPADRRQGRMARGALPVLRPSHAVPPADRPAPAAAPHRGRGHGGGDRREGRAGPRRDRSGAGARGALSSRAPVHRPGERRSGSDAARQRRAETVEALRGMLVRGAERGRRWW